jgi:hypothetical protein
MLRPDHQEEPITREETKLNSEDSDDLNYFYLRKILMYT